MTCYKIHTLGETYKYLQEEKDQERVIHITIVSCVIKWLNPIIFVSNIFPNSHLKQLLIMYTFLNHMKIGKNIQHKDDRMNSV